MKQKTSGFTLIEVMVAIVILSIGLLALAGATANVSKMVGYGKWATVASQVATRRVEIIRQIANSITDLQWQNRLVRIASLNAINTP